MTLLIALVPAACGIPRDPDKSSERIKASHELRVGISDNPPWTDARAEPTGIEANIVRSFAAREGAKILWTRGSETSLAQGLKRHELDLAIGGFDAKTPWKAIAGVSQAFAETSDKKKHVFLAAPGENRFILSLDTYLTERSRGMNGSGA